MNLKCVKYMSLNDTEECDSAGVPFFCKEGSGCIPNETSSTGYLCMPILAKAAEYQPCSTDEECNPDSYCECNSTNGIMSCVPYMASNLFTLTFYKEALKEGLDSEKGMDYMDIIYAIYYPHDKDYRCIYEDTKSSSSSSSSSSSTSQVIAEESSSSSQKDSYSSIKSGVANVKPVVALIIGFIAMLF